MKVIKLIGAIAIVSGAFSVTTFINANAQAATIPYHYRGAWTDRHGNHLKIHATYGYEWNSYSTHKVRMNIRTWPYNGHFWKYAMTLSGKPMATTVLGYYHGHVYVRLGTSHIKYYR